MKQIFILLISLLILPLAYAEETELPPAKCPGTLESSAVLGGTDLALTVRTRGLATQYQGYPAFEQTLETGDGRVLLTYTAQKLYDDVGGDWSCADELPAAHRGLVDSILGAIRAGGTAETFTGPLLEDILACLSGSRQDCDSANHHQLQLTYGMTDKEAKTILEMVADGAVEFTVSESAYIHITYYYAPGSGLIRPVLEGGC